MKRFAMGPIGPLNALPSVAVHPKLK